MLNWTLTAPVGRQGQVGGHGERHGIAAVPGGSERGSALQHPGLGEPSVGLQDVSGN